MGDTFKGYVVVFTELIHNGLETEIAIIINLLLDRKILDHFDGFFATLHHLISTCLARFFEDNFEIHSFGDFVHGNSIIFKVFF